MLNRKQLEALLELAAGNGDEDLVAAIREELHDLGEIEDRQTYRLESQWDPAYIADLLGTYDGPELWWEDR